MIYHGSLRKKARTEFLCQVHNGLNRLRSDVSTSSCDMILFRRKSEIDYLGSVNGTQSTKVDEFSGM